MKKRMIGTETVAVIDLRYHGALIENGAEYEVTRPEHRNFYLEKVSGHGLVLIEVSEAQFDQIVKRGWLVEKGEIEGTPVGPVGGEVIEKLASGNGVRRIAVENFLGTLPLELTMKENLANLASDQRAYGWNQATYRAIEKGIRIAYGKAIAL